MSKPKRMTIEDLALIASQGFQTINERFEKIENRLDKIEVRLDRIEADINLMKNTPTMKRELSL